MNDTLLDQSERRLLASLVGQTVEQLVWDLNALYVVEHERVLKVEPFEGMLHTPEPVRDVEAMGLRVAEDESRPRFRAEGEQGYWYRVLAEAVRLEAIDLVRTALVMPTEQVIHPATPSVPGATTLCDCGILITTKYGVLPGVQLGNSYGFAHWGEPRWHSRDEVMQALEQSYEVLSLDPRAV